MGRGTAFPFLRLLYDLPNTELRDEMMSGMSTEQPLDPQLIEQTKQQIRALYAEIAQFARSENITAEEFYAEMLHRVIQALAAVGGVVWAKRDQGQLALQYQIALNESRLAEKSEEDQMRHGHLLHKVMTTGEGLLVPPHSGAGDSDQAANPTDWLVVLGPLKNELEVIGVVEVFQRPGADLPIQRGYLRFLLEVCALASEFLNSRQLRNFSDRQTLWTQLEEFARSVHNSLNPRDTAYTIANEGRRLIECDRVSVAIRKGKKCVIESVSGQDLVDKRSNTVRLLGRLATVVVASEEPMWYTGDTHDMAPQVEDAVQEYVDESHTKMIAVLPLCPPKPPEKDKERPGDPDDAMHPIGALIVEQIEDSRIAPRMRSRIEVVNEHSATAMTNALEHENVFLMPVWRTLGKSRVIVEGRNLPKTALVAVGIVAVIAAMFLVSWDFRIYAKGTLEPVHRREVFASLGGDAKVVKVNVEHGDEVKKDQLLVELDSFRLREDLAKLDIEILPGEDQKRRYQRQLSESSRSMPPEDKGPYRGRVEGPPGEARRALHQSQYPRIAKSRPVGQEPQRRRRHDVARARSTPRSARRARTSADARRRSHRSLAVGTAHGGGPDGRNHRDAKRNTRQGPPPASHGSGGKDAGTGSGKAPRGNHQTASAREVDIGVVDDRPTGNGAEWHAVLEQVDIDRLGRRRAGSPRDGSIGRPE